MTSGIILTPDINGKVKQDSFERPKIEYSPALQDEIKSDMADLLCNATFTKSQKMDANESAFLVGELTRMIGKTFMKWYPQFTSKQLFKVNSSNYYPGIDFLKYIEGSRGGKAKIASKKDNTKRYANIAENEVPSPVVNVELFANFDWYSLQNAIRNGKPLEQKLLDATREGTEQTLNELVFGIHKSNDGDSTYSGDNIPGICNSLGLAKMITVADDGTNLANDNILTNSAADNLTYLSNIIGVPHSFTNNPMAAPDTLAMPIPQVLFIQKQYLGAEYSKTVAEKMFELGIKRIIGCPELKNVGRNSITDGLLAFNSSEDIAEIMEVMPWTPRPMQNSGFNYEIPTHASTGGLFIYRKAIAFVKNCGA